LKNKIDFSKPLISWYNKNDFQFPWRQTKDPYKIWISEIMLQQTQVSTVIKYYNRWIDKYPTIEKLSKSHIDDLVKMWEGLGYYRRVHNIHATARHILNNLKGKFPNEYDELIKCKGIGDYTASAILSIAFSKKHSAIDGNLKRILSRVYLLGESKNIEKKYKSHMDTNMGNENPGDINQAMMDLGREICKPQNPNCGLCPIKAFCKAFKNGKIALYPIKQKKRKVPLHNVIVGVIWSGKKFLISKRKSTGHLAGLWELPGGKKNKNEKSIECLEREIDEELNINVELGDKIGKIKHKYSHFHINLTAYNCYYNGNGIKSFEAQEIKWIDMKQIKNFAFPKATIKIFELMG